MLLFLPPRVQALIGIAVVVLGLALQATSSPGSGPLASSSAAPGGCTPAATAHCSADRHWPVQVRQPGHRPPDP